MLDSFAYYGTWFAVFQCFQILENGNLLLLLQLVLTLLDFMSFDLIYSYLKQIDITHGSFNILKNVSSLFFVRKKILSGKISVKVLFYNLKVCVFRTIIIAVI